MLGDRTVGYFCRYLPSLRSPEVFGLLFQSTCIGFFALKVAIAGNAPAVVEAAFFRVAMVGGIGNLKYVADVTAF